MKKWLGVVCFSLFGTIVLTGCSKIGSEVSSEVNSEIDSQIDSALDSEEDNDLKIANGEDVGEGEVELLTPEIDEDEDELEFMTSGVDEGKMTFIYVANEKVFEQNIENEQNYQVDIEGIEDAHRTDYKPKFQLVQFENDEKEGDITTFKQERYSVEDY